MPFLIRSSRRLPVQCSVTYNAASFRGQSNVWGRRVASWNGYKLYVDF
jgi:hypothetical protein